MKSKIKLIITLLISIILICNLPIYSNASSIEDIFTGAKDFINSGGGASTVKPSEESLAKISNMVSSVLLTIAGAVTFISIAVMGFSFAVQTVEDKAKIKESMIPWVIGVIVSFGAYGIWKIVISIGYGLNLG